MLQQWHTFVEQMHNDDPTMAVDGMTNLSIAGAATPVNLMGPPNDVIGYGTLRSTGGQMFDALSDKVDSSAPLNFLNPLFRHVLLIVRLNFLRRYSRFQCDVGCSCESVKRYSTEFESYGYYDTSVVI